MEKDGFWQVIDGVNAKLGRGDQAAVLRATETALMAFHPQDILDWHNIKDVYMKQANRLDLWAACTATHSHDTDDGFTDFRAWLISQGKDVYMAALADPDSLAGLDVPACSCNFESYN